MRNLKFREVRQLARHHTAAKWQSQGQSTRLSAPDAHAPPTFPPSPCHKGSNPPSPDPSQNLHSDKTSGDCVLSGFEKHSLRAVRVSQGSRTQTAPDTLAIL